LYWKYDFHGHSSPSTSRQKTVDLSKYTILL
jgi:hypothetical protein